MADDNDIFDIGPNAEKLGIFAVFMAKGFPIIIKILLGLIFLGAAVLLVPFLFTFFPDQDISQIGKGIIAIIILILTLALSAKL